uniref:Uncharacterized protein n=1 Tax=Ditylenchus dipsaci TaxID=166011 RepID=A0A915E352_9BILA
MWAHNFSNQQAIDEIGINWNYYPEDESFYNILDGNLSDQEAREQCEQISPSAMLTSTNPHICRINTIKCREDSTSATSLPTQPDSISTSTSLLTTSTDMPTENPDNESNSPEDSLSSLIKEAHKLFKIRKPLD